MKDLVWGVAAGEDDSDPLLAKILNMDYLMREYPGQPAQTWETVDAIVIELLIELGKARAQLREVEKVMNRA